MTIPEILREMIARADGNLHDTAHFVKVWAYAHAIGELEKLDGETQRIVEISAIIHDIAIPLCRRKYGNADGKLQERESDPLVREFLTACGCEPELIDRAAFLVSHHHTYDPVLGLDHQILLEADYLVNAEENGYSAENVQNAGLKIFRTDAGKTLLRKMFRL